MRLPSRFIATRSGTVTFFGAGVDAPPYWSLTSNLRPGRLRAGPGVNAIVARAHIRHDSFQIADGRQEERSERQDDRDRPGDDEDERRTLALCQKCGADGSDGCKQRPAEVVHARDTTQDPT